MKGQPRISHIYRMGETESTGDPLEEWGRIESLRRNAWRRAGVIALRPSELPDDLASKLTQWADEQYGRRET